MKQQTIAFIGAGNLATSLISGLLNTGFNANHIWASHPNSERANWLKQRFAIHTTTDNKVATQNTDIVMICVKPNKISDVLNEISSSIDPKHHLVISAAAGVNFKKLQTLLGKETAIIRTIPNTPSFVQAGASALCANEFCSEEQREQAESLMRAVGLALWLDNENFLDIVTGLSGSGPAYFFLFMEALQNAAIQQGLPEKTAQLLTIQTALGAARMALETDFDLATLRQQVTSKGGTTEKAIEVLENGDIRKLLSDALKAAIERARQLSE